MKEALNHTSVLKSLNIKIDDVNVGVEDLVQLELYWDADRISVSGNLMIKDNIDLLNSVKPNNNTIVTLYAVDNTGYVFTKKFRTLQFDIVKEDKKFNTINIKLLDVLTFNMRNTFISKGYANASIEDVFKDYLKNYLDNPFYKEEMQYSNTPKKDFIVVPNDRSFFDFFKDYLHRDGYHMFQFRNTISIVKNTDVLPESLETSADVLSELYYLSDHPFKIHEHSLKINDTMQLLENAPMTKTIKFNVSKTPITQETMVNPDVELNWSDVDYIKTKGIKNNLHSISSQEQTIDNFNKNLMQNSELELVLTGNLNNTKLNTNYEVVFNGNVFHKQGQNEGDIRTSGLYTVKRITDKIVSGKIVQKVNLVRADFNER